MHQTMLLATLWRSSKSLSIVCHSLLHLLLLSIKHNISLSSELIVLSSTELKSYPRRVSDKTSDHLPSPSLSLIKKAPWGKKKKDINSYQPLLQAPKGNDHLASFSTLPHLIQKLSLPGKSQAFFRLLLNAESYFEVLSSWRRLCTVK